MSSATLLHRWLSLLLAIPIVIWSITGCYFVIMDLDYIRGNHITHNKPRFIPASQIDYPISTIYQRYPKAKEISLILLNDTPYYQIKLSNEIFLLNTTSGERLALLTEKQARLIASEYQHNGAITPNAKLINATKYIDKGPTELPAKHLPAWRLDFNDSAATTLYISAVSGELVTRRHNYWRLFDLFWKWHIMDYDDGADIDNSLLLSTALASIVTVLTGTILLWQRRRKYLK
ncbi:MAG: peptidase [Shewanella sp.]